jgi:hypothetical protein
MYTSPQSLLEAWLDGVNRADVAAVLELYNEKAILLPTFSDKSLATGQQLQRYFEYLFAKKCLRVSTLPASVIDQALSTDHHSLNGLYIWEWWQDGAVLYHKARFSFVIDLSLSAPILHHHSSQLPRML